jgi:uncharacterized hydrophobic protein (TIGR00341 family)
MGRRLDRRTLLHAFVAGRDGMKLFEVIAAAGSADTVQAIAATNDAHDFRVGLRDEHGRQAMEILVPDHRVQAVLDGLQSILGGQPDARILVIPLEVSLPAAPERPGEESATAAREVLYASVEREVRVDANFFVLVLLSTVVAAIGLIEDNVAVVIGAMVIAPLLGANIALGLATALGDYSLMRRALAVMASGIGLAVGLSLAIGWLLPFEPSSRELLTRTNPGLDSAMLALASGVAAALSVTSGLSSVLVGVMVAVALLPPAATLGLTLGRGRFDLASGAGILLAVNVVSVNLACKIVFLVKGIRPRNWWERQKARRAMTIYLVVWVLTLGFLVLVMYLQRVSLPLGVS